ncbi:MAG: gamma-glutamylcyclotransferase [SAR324 cluster bacterium]|nr:gamma-glutamylcyclotransferase [SAR324 cluster bacterium]
MKQLKGILFDISVYINTEYRLREFGALTETLEDDLFTIPVRMNAGAGYVRAWCGRFDGLQTQYDLRPVKKGETPRTINGVFRAIYDEAMLSYTSEHGRYDKIPIEHFAALGWQSLPGVLFVYIFRAKSVASVDIEYPILQSYLDTCLKGYLEYGEDFAIEFLETTGGWSKFWINDREVARRPWIHEGKYKVLDALLAKHPSTGNTFQHRKLEVEYTRYFMQPALAHGQENEVRPAGTRADFSRKLETQTVNFIFGFGSLINSRSRFQTNPGSKDAVPVKISSAFGYLRCWNFHGATSLLTALGVRELSENEMGRSINGIIYPADGEDMSLCDEREEGYLRVELPWEYVEPLSWFALPDPSQTRLWMYVPELSQPPSREYPILQSYIDVCLSGCLEFGEDFAREFLETTFEWSPFWINDRVLARRPWIHCPNYAEIDRLLEKFPKEENVFHNRKLAVEYAALFFDENENR